MSAFSTVANADSAEAYPTGNILFRVFMIRGQYGAGTSFIINVNQREYWVTAKHILTGDSSLPVGKIKDKKIELQVLNPNSEQEQWLTESFSVLDPGEGIDIVVLVPQTHLFTPLPHPISLTTDSVMLGGNCEFLGFPDPVGNKWRGEFEGGQYAWMPFVKHCTISAMTYKNPKILYLDGINNHGFSGGPVIYKTGPEQQIIGVISGYYGESGDVLGVSTTSPPSPIQPKEIVNLNSGFFIAFNISYVVDAINKNPIGLLQDSK